MTRISSLLGFLLFWPLSLLPSAAFAGADQGNPQVFYNLRFDYALTLKSEWTVTPQADHSLRVDVPLTYRKLGYLVVGKTAPIPPKGSSVCDSRSAGGDGLQVYWLGSDCTHPFFKQQLNDIQGAVRHLAFPNIP